MLSMPDRLPDAVRLFEELKKWDLETCNVMISCYARSGLVEQALGFFVMALRNGVLPTEFTFASVLRWSSCFGLLKQGGQIHALVYQRSLKHARELFNGVCVKDLLIISIYRRMEESLLLILLLKGRKYED
ncbi:hypothetical protein VPH35_139745 [Triticum aestivum]|uniref:Pentatricopeptide repeat-containing protein n=1 Tax=Aegilops tauschii subsp. strangulata TaxID=200361 RepID=A0A453SZA0_AEGTS